jgi:hypothetical protein
MRPEDGDILTTLQNLVSLFTSFYFLLFVPHGFSFRAALWAALISAAEHFAGQYMHNFWNDKAKIPLMDDYNEAISHTVNVIGLSDVLAVGWGVLCVMKLIGL